MIRHGLAFAFAFAMAVNAVLPLAAPPARAAAGIDFSGSLGRTFAILGDVREGGEAFQLDALLPMRDSWSIGYAFYAADMGQGTERLLDPNDGTDLGAVGGPTRFVVGVGWALDVRPWAGKANAPGVLRAFSAAGTAGHYRIKVETQGDVLEDDDAFGWSLAGRWHFPVGAHAFLGPSVRYTRVFDDRFGRFMSAGMDWTWR
jgi:hypothetical protein